MLVFSLHFNFSALSKALVEYFVLSWKLILVTKYIIFRLGKSAANFRIYILKIIQNMPSKNSKE